MVSHIQFGQVPDGDHGFCRRPPPQRDHRVVVDEHILGLDYKEDMGSGMRRKGLAEGGRKDSWT